MTTSALKERLDKLANGPILAPIGRFPHNATVFGPGRRKPTVARGYAAPPGTGPEGETCRSCKHKKRLSNGGKKSFLKCEAFREHWTHGPGTDIKAGTAACREWAAP